MVYSVMIVDINSNACCSLFCSSDLFYRQGLDVICNHQINGKC
eukprot:UN07443